jgi:hypothetical protein
MTFRIREALQIPVGYDFGCEAFTASSWIQGHLGGDLDGWAIAPKRSIALI